MSSTIQFPDQIYIEQIRQHLWSGREFGRAAVMVGAGFSRNAQKSVASIPEFPLWNDIAAKMFDALYPVGSSEEARRERSKIAMTSGAPLRLASEYEAAFTRSALDDLLLNAIQDTGYHPGNLHRMLLSLPWADVFTTNYDTLLERTRQFIYDRKYDVVLDTSDIPVAARPRIVKLHGSFPSQRPFIITEEDFRTYPNKFSPFVNLVQQSMMENVFCLLGFSGDDPNFLNWTGWVRDKLASHTQPIYLCGILSLSTFQRKLLEGRNVIPIDLSPLFPESSWLDQAVRHAKALEWFLLALLYGEPANLVHWPKSVSRNVWTPSPDLPALVAGPRQLSPLGERSPKGLRRLTTEELKSLYENWNRKREEYPGWVVLPNDNREQLWEYTKYWIDPIFRSLGQLSSPDDLFVLFELNWRFERTLSPYPTRHAESILKILSEYNPFPERYSGAGQLRPDNAAYAHWSWQKIADCWIRLSFAVLRHWRENMNGDRFLSEMEKLRELVRQKALWQSRWYHEYGLFFLGQSDFNSVRSLLSDWNIPSELPFWKTKKAAVMAEIGELDRARQLGEEALAGIRSQFTPGETNYTLLSQEGWTMLLLRGIRMNQVGEESGYLDQFTDRWTKLATYHCNPWLEIETLETIVKAMMPLTDVRNITKPGGRKITKPGYYSSTERVSYEIAGETAYAKLQPAFNFLRIFEEGGIPIRAGATALFTDAALNAARCIHAFSPALSLSIRLRIGKSPEEDNWLDLATVAGLSDEEVAYVYPVFRNSFIEALNHLTRHPEEVGGFLASTNFRRALVFSDLLSRLVPRLTETQIEEILQIAVQVYLSPVVQSHHTLHKCQAILFKRALQSASSDHQIRVLPQLLTLPLPGEGGFQVSSPDQWDDPFMSVGVRVGSRAISTIDRAAIGPSISNLIRLIADGNAESRWRAILRVSHLHEIGILTAEETEQFATALWSRIDETGLPAETRMRRNAILLLPEPSLGLAKDKLKTYLLSTDFYGRAKQDGAGNEGTSFGLSFGTQDLILEWCHATAQVPLTDETPSSTLIDWSTDEVVALLDKAISWWNDQKRFLTQADAFPLVADNLRADFDGLVDLLMKVIVPRLKVGDVENLKRAIGLIEELDQAGIVVLPVLPLLSVDSNLYNEVRHKIQSGLLSNDPIQVDGALLGLRDWIIYSRRGNLPSPPPYFLDQMIVFIADRRVIGLERALMYMTDLLITVPDMFEERHLELILLGMTALIRETNVEGSVDDGFIDTGDKPRVRRRAAKLANQLWRRYQDLGKPIPEAIERWKIIGETDPLAFVRKAWRSLDLFKRSPH